MVPSGTTLATRAVERPIVPDVDACCAHCCERIRFTRPGTARRVIANIYTDGRWDHVEHFHDLCYVEAGQPHGPAAPGTAERFPAVAGRASELWRQHRVMT
jgi:hypothetical protein